MTHEVHVLCNCDDVENCIIERYVSDVRIAYKEIQRLSEDVAFQTAQHELLSRLDE
jgi:hypothetical protein